MNGDATPTDRRSVIVPPWGDDDRFAANLFVPLRLILALVVIFSHSFPLCRGPAAVDPLQRLTGQLTLGDVAVGLFLAISGFLVARSRELSSSVGSFLWKRILRVYPAFLALTVVQAFVVAPLAGSGRFAGYTGRQLGLILFEGIDLVGYGFPYGGLSTPFTANPFPAEMNGSLWTIRYEFVCYLLLAAGGVAFRRAWVLVLALMAVSMMNASGWLLPWNRWLTALVGAIGPWPRLLSHFLAGALFYRLRRSIPRDDRLAGLAAAVLGGAAIGGMGLHAILPIAGVYLLFWLAYAPGLVRRWDTGTGDFSYGTYLYGFPIQQSVMMGVAPHWEMDPYRLAAVAIPLSLTAGALSWYLVERPLLALKPRGRLAPSSHPSPMVLAGSGASQS